MVCTMYIYIKITLKLSVDREWQFTVYSTVQCDERVSMCVCVRAKSILIWIRLMSFQSGNELKNTHHDYSVHVQ